VTVVKICGLTRAEDVDAAVAAGADLIGFVLVPGSPRAVAIDTARALAARVPSPVRTVAVVAEDGDSPRLRAGFDLVQTYDTPARFDDTIVASRGEPPAGVPDRVPVLLDMPYGSRPGPAELRAHWERVASVRQPVILAGSLDPANVAEAIAVARPWAVDTARGVEAAPGVKDHDLVRAFVRTAKEAT
jgi:phosphoribosylanthranilate isomerase